MTIIGAAIHLSSFPFAIATQIDRRFLPAYYRMVRIRRRVDGEPLWQPNDRHLGIPSPEAGQAFIDHGWLP